MWFKQRMNQLRAEGSPEATDELWSLANGPGVNVRVFSGCVSNGIRFHTVDRDSRHQSQNSGLVAQGEHKEQPIDFYGRLCRVWEMSYMFEHRVVLFQWEWFKNLRTDMHFTSIDVRSRWYTNDPFILPSQVNQVFYINDPKLGNNWKIVQRVQRRGIWDIPEIDGEGPSDVATDDAFQQDETTSVPAIVKDLVDVEFNRTDIDPEIIPSQVVLQSSKRARTVDADDYENESIGEAGNDQDDLHSESDSDIDLDMEP